MASASGFRNDLLAAIPSLRAFAVSLAQNADKADDLVQETLVKAWDKQKSFQPGTNLKAWLFTILRNQFYSDRRRAWRQAPWDQDAAERIPGGGEDQVYAAELSDTARALRRLSDEQREALILVGAGGFSYEDAAAICKCAVGTVKSRVARARKTLIEILDGDDTLDESGTRPREPRLFLDAAADVFNVQLFKLDLANRAIKSNGEAE